MHAEADAVRFCTLQAAMALNSLLLQAEQYPPNSPALTDALSQCEDLLAAEGQNRSVHLQVHFYLIKSLVLIKSGATADNGPIVMVRPCVLAPSPWRR